MRKIKNCPFCNAENTDAAGFMAHTDECYLMQRYMNNSSSKELADAWDTRPIEDALQAEIERLNTVLNEWYMAWITDCIAPQPNGNEAFGVDEGLVLCARMMKPILEETRLLLGKTESSDGL